MDFPVKFYRKRTWQIILSGIMTLFSAGLFVCSLTAGHDPGIYIAAAALFAASLILNIVLAATPCFIVEKDRLVSKALFMPDTVIDSSLVASVVNDGDMLRIGYNTPDVAKPRTEAAKKLYEEGLCVCFIRKADTSVPLSDVEKTVKTAVGIKEADKE